MLFFDTNVLVYSQDAREPAKRAVARALVEQAIAAGSFTMSTQVMQEFYSVATRKGLLSPAHATALLQAWAANEVTGASAELVFRAFALQQARQLSLWDALVVQSAVDAGCSTLFSEDLQHESRYGPVTVVNPFLQPLAVHEAAAPYATKRSRRRA